MTHHLQHIFWDYGFTHPSWFVRIVERIARRRFVSFEEIEGRILDWYTTKYGYPAMFVRQHGIDRQLWRWRRIGGVIGERLWNGIFDCHKRRPLYCRLDDQGHRVDSQHCEYCGAGINPVWNGKPKERLTCRSPHCHAIHRWIYQGKRGATRAGRHFAWSVHRELRLAALLWWYLDSLTRNRQRVMAA